MVVHHTTTNAYQIQGGTDRKSFINIMMCVSAAGDMLPPYVIYNSKRLFGE